MSGEQQLRAFIERILRLKEEQDTLAADIREVYAEAKGSGFDKTAMGQLVAHLRKVEKVGVAAVEEGQTVFDTYLDAYRRATGTVLATHTHAGDVGRSYAEAKGVDRQARARQRTSEAMDDAKALSAEAAALGLIDPDAHAETARIADAIAKKYGAGVIDPEIGEITEQEQPETATQSGPLNEVRSGGDRQPDAGNVDEDGNAPAESVTISAPHSNPPPVPSDQHAEATAADQPEAVVPPPTTVSGEPFEPPAFLKKEKTGCLKLNNGHCKIGFATDALCSACNQARMARAGA